MNTIWNPQSVATQRKQRGLRTLTLQEYHQKTGKGQQGYQRYINYVANHSLGQAPKGPGAPPSQAANPWAAFLPVATNVGQRQATQQGNQIYAPAIQATNQNYLTDSQNLQHGITQYSQDMAKYLTPQPQQALDISRQTAGALAATGAALAQSGKGYAAEGQKGLADYLSLAGASPAAGQFATDAGTMGNVIASGIAAASQAAQEKALYGGDAQSKYLAGLPSIFALSGQQSLAGGLRDLMSKKNTTLGDLRTQRAKEIASLFTDFQNREYDKAATYATIKRFLIGEDNSLTKAEIAAKAKADAAAAKNAAPSAALSKVYGYIVDGKGRAILKNGKIQPVKTSSGKSGDTNEYGVKQTQVNQAVTKIGSVLAAAAKPTTKEEIVEVTVPAGQLVPGGQFIRALPNGKMVYAVKKKRTVRPQVGSAAYNQAVNRAVQTVTPLLPGYPPQVIIRMVQKVALTYFATAG